MKAKDKEEKPKKHLLRKTLILILLLLVVLVLYSRYIGTKGLIVKEYKVESNTLPKSFSGIKIIHFSDLYYANTTIESDLVKIENQINELNPDIIIFTGNIYTKYKKMNEKDTNILIEFFNNLDATTGKYIIKGASDYKIDYDNFLTKIDYTYLNNSYDIIYHNSNEPIFIGGIPSISKDVIDSNKLFDNYISTDTENTKIKPEYKIIITSEGNAFENIINGSIPVNLMLGSASLDGSVKVPFYGPLYIPKNCNKYYAPYYKLENSEIFISSGIGTDNINFRFNNKPSINLYRLKSI